MGPVAEEETATGFPAITSEGSAVIEVTEPQLKVFAVTRADPGWGAAVLHCRETETLVVDRAVVLKDAEPAHVTVPSTDVPESEMR